jgi:hypothetical protein
MRNKFFVLALSITCLPATLTMPGQAEASGGHGRHHGWSKHYWRPPQVRHEHYYYVPPPAVPVYEYHHHHYEQPRYVAPYVWDPIRNGVRFSVDFNHRF